MDRLYFDTNVLLDVLEQRAPWFPDSAACLGLARNGSVTGAISAITLADISYIQRKNAPEKIYDVFSRLLEFLEIVEMGDAVVRHAFERRLPDVEDGFQLEAAIRWKATHLVTRNVRDFPSDVPVNVLSPAEYLALVGR